jgi:uncharacterized membrane protein
LITVTLYTKDNCSLCDQALADLEAIKPRLPHNLALVNIDEDPDLKETYADRVPVLQVGPYTLEAPFDRKKIEMTLGAASDRMKHIGKAAASHPSGKSASNRMENVGQWLSRNYLSALNFFVFIYLALPFLAPILMNAGQPALARPIYSVYGAVCHQMAFRSWFLFGDQPVYPRSAAGLDDLQSYGEATGLDESNSTSAMLDARAFIGDEQIGYKVAFCQRDVAIYGGILLFGLVFAATSRRIRPLHWLLWLAIGVAPIGIDGFSQLFSQIPALDFIPYRESTPLLRTITGALFGITTAWFGIPLLEADATAARVKVVTKKARPKSGRE